MGTKLEIFGRGGDFEQGCQIEHKAEGIILSSSESSMST